jgi:hypothetical protein
MAKVSAMSKTIKLNPNKILANSRERARKSLWGMCLFLLVLLLFILPPVASATSWYVDSTASGSNNGSSWANAWKSFAAINWGSIRAGETLYISGGSVSQTYTEAWSVGAAGSNGSPITIAVGQDTGHNGTVIFDFNGDGDNSTRTAIAAQHDYITFDGSNAGVSHFQINNLRNTQDRTASTGIDASGTTGLVVKYVTFINDNNPIAATGSTGFSIHHNSLQQVRGDAAMRLAGSSGSFDASRIYSNYVETMQNSCCGGPDGIQVSSGVSMYNNTFKEIVTSVITSTQHPDMVQATGNYLKFYNNEVINIGDSAFDFDCYANSNPHDVWIYNNVFHIIDVIDPYPEYFRLYTSGAGIQSINNFKILNNVFVDAPGASVVRFNGFNGNPTGSGNEIRNNIWYNDGNGVWEQYFYIDDSSGFTANSFTFSNNVYYTSTGTAHVFFRGTDYTVADWVAGHEPSGSTAEPTFVSYVANGANNDFHLKASDTVARDTGIDLSSFFNIDKDGVTRPQGSAWDRGPYEFQPGGQKPDPPTNLKAIVN